MGGGDLNLKKSWHPQTLKNIERVWKAEQKHEAERKKIEELQKELKDERAREEITKFAQETGTLKKKDERLDWMYQGPSGHISREEYLLGRPIDKQITQQYEEQESGPSAETGLLPGSIFSTATSVSSLDMAAKIREDPLFEIRKREEDKKRSVLTNPVKMREIKKMLRQNIEKERKKRRKKDKKGMREEKKKRKEKKHKRRSSSSDKEDKKCRSKEENGFVTSSHSDHKSSYGLQLPAGRSHQSLEYHHADHRTRERSHSPLGNHFSHVEDKRPKPKAPSPPRHRDRFHRPQYTNYSKRLSAEELEKRRKEMMGFARDREEERESNVLKYKRQDEEERARDGTRYGRDAGFIHNMKLESASTSSLEDRVKRNMHSIQRTQASLEKNFMRR
ncbi:pre-mRNA-splicing factor CWC25 homolog [Electrophorus electricus]|uniref:CBF1-interacting co-repressor CIR N-terminal domain-containing protein n=1 Tax=Electrophorus electricus TaxID=8005 RepID=A0A4W4FH28_ELEEL|nr:pre-mRNA-splicing factor CWC25 homolog [Electrophorus electricus]